MLLYISFLLLGSFKYVLVDGVCRHQFGCVYPALVFVHVSSNCFFATGAGMRMSGSYLSRSFVVTLVTLKLF